MTRRTFLKPLGLVLIACSAGLAVLPASWLMKAVPAQWPLAIVEASGTVWSGSATLAIGPAASRRTVPDPIRWQWSIARGPQVDVRHPWLSGPLTLVPKPNGLVISSQTLTLPAQALATLDARIAAINPTGVLSLSWPPALIGPESRAPGTPLVQADWRDAGSALSPIHPLGHYVLTLQQGKGKGNETEITLTTRKGPLMLEGVGAMSASGQLRFKGTARSDPSAGHHVNTGLQEVLNAMGPRQNDLTLLHYR